MHSVSNRIFEAQIKSPFPMPSRFKLN